MSAIRWETRGARYTRGIVGRSEWCTIARIDRSKWFQKPQYEYVLRTTIKSAGTHEHHHSYYGGFFLTREEAMEEAQVILGMFIKEATTL